MNKICEYLHCEEYKIVDQKILINENIIGVFLRKSNESLLIEINKNHNKTKTESIDLFAEDFI